MKLKLALLLVGGPMALAAPRLGRDWIFFLGIGLLVLALVLPSRPGQTIRAKFASIVGHLPGARWLAPGRLPGDETGE